MTFPELHGGTNGGLRSNANLSNGIAHQFASSENKTQPICGEIIIFNYWNESILGYELLKLLKSSVELSNFEFKLLREPELEIRAVGRRLIAEKLKLAFVTLPPNALESQLPLLTVLLKYRSRVPLVVVTEGMVVSSLCGLLDLGAVDFLSAPLKACEVIPRLLRLLQHAWNIRPTLQNLKQHFGLQQIIGTSPVLQKECAKIPQFAGCDATVLISGETGTGKEICARAIHYLGPRSGGPFVAANCGAMPVELIENELFGHESGAYTSARAAQTGLVEEADGGTLFLDEVDALPPSAQVKLLRFLQDKEYRPLGARKVRRANVRIIAAANAVFEEAIQAGKFRRDLYYRLNVLPLNLPPLRERREDIPLLARHFVEKYSTEFKRCPGDLTPDAVQTLFCYDWPGNVRELENIIERAVLLSQEATIHAKDLALHDARPSAQPQSFHTLKAQAVARFERGYLQMALRIHNGNIAQAARTAQKNRRAFWELLRKHNLTSERPRKIS
jgi:DNA-binding NtrC family response regulator